MLSSLRWRLTAAFLVVSLLGLGTAAVLSHTLTFKEFDQMRAQQQSAEYNGWAVDFYAANGTLDGFDDYLRSSDGPRPSMPPPEGQTQPGGQGGRQPGSLPRTRFLLVDLDGIAQSNVAPLHIGELVSAEVVARGFPVEVDGTQVGTLVDTLSLPVLDPDQQAFLNRTDRALLIASGVAGVVALVAGAVLARGLSNPITRLTHALTTVGKEAPTPMLDARARGEVGELVRAFNRMSADLARSNQIRRQMTADIAHELRSPLSVISGYLEGLRDGTLSATSDRFDAIYEETQQLRHLIDDLRTLSLADAGELALRFEQAYPSDLLADAHRSFVLKAKKQGVTLEVESAPDLPPVKVDRARMMQVLSNLIHNALRYTPEAGTITLTAARQGAQVQLMVKDTGRGIPADKLPNLFQRFYRVEDDREQADGQTGIGLAIVKALVEMHGGSVRAESEGLGHGSSFMVQLPAT